MKIALRNVRNKLSIVDIPENSTEIAVINITGDQVLVYPVFYDTGYDNRINDYFEDHKIFRIEELDDAEIDGQKCLLVSGI